MTATCAVGASLPGVGQGETASRVLKEAGPATGLQPRSLARTANLAMKQPGALRHHIRRGVKSVPKGISGCNGEKTGKGHPSCPEDGSTRFARCLQPSWQRLDIFNRSLWVEAIVPIDGFENRIDLNRDVIIVPVDCARSVVRTLHVREKRSSLGRKADVLAGHCKHPMVHQCDEPSAHRSSLADRHARVKASAQSLARTTVDQP